MRKTYSILLIAMITLSCSTYKRDKFQYRNDDINVWTNTFKSEVFYYCIQEGLKNDSLFKILKKKDLFNLFDGYPITIIDSARSLGKKVIINMPEPFIKIDNDEENLKNRNFISYSCLNYYASRELDKKAYKMHLKKQKESIQVIKYQTMDQQGKHFKFTLNRTELIERIYHKV